MPPIGGGPSATILPDDIVPMPVPRAVRPEWVRCIAHTHADHAGEAWCTATIDRYDKPFLDIDHAAYEGLRQGRLVPCGACVAAIIAALGKGA